ncbi:acyl carrier protein [Methyloferula stellata]|jgi:acyl carrier protein|uniref:acyl carrier protein n=1 Tax=Methyloferula stellata TaxID=876270 RepID=UPI00036443EA|nr:acyl carrier protein [Methyloferula stellata]
MTQPDLLAALTEIFRENFDDEKLVLTMKTTAGDIAGWDSAKMVMLVLAVEERFDVRFRSREIDALRSIGDWVALIEAAAASRPQL